MKSQEASHWAECVLGACCPSVLVRVYVCSWYGTVHVPHTRGEGRALRCNCLAAVCGWMVFSSMSVGDSGHVFMTSNIKSTDLVRAESTTGML